jgi:hypothetical protein
MKKLVLLFIASFLCFLGLSGQTATLSTPGGVPGLKWTTDSTVSVGQVELNKPVTITFGFVNNGKAPLVISRVEPSCGCTAVDYTKEPVGPNQKGYIKATYNAASVGVFSKNITVFSNAADMRKVLVLKGEVIKK